MSYAERTMTEPYTSREVRTVPGEGGANLPPQDGKAVPPYSTKLGSHNCLWWMFFPDDCKHPLYLSFLAFHVRMNIAFQRHIGISVAQDLAQRLDVTAVLQAGGSKRMAQSMGVYPAHPGPAQIALDTLAVAARLHWSFSDSREKPGVRAGAAPQLAQQKDQVMRDRYLTA